MTVTIRRVVSSCFALSVAAAGLAIPAPVQAQYGQPRAVSQQRPPEGSHVWGEDGWCYVMHGGRWVRTSYSRVFPDRTNPRVFDVYQNGRFVRRVGVGVSVPGGSRQSSAAEVQLQGLINQLYAEIARQPQAPAPTQRSDASAQCETIPMYGPLTPAQKKCNEKMIAAMQNAEAMRQMGKIRCQDRAGHPYRSKRVGPDGLTYYLLNDGSEQREGGSLNSGWHWTQVGPQPNACY